MNIFPRFIVIDDDKFNNALCKMVIGKICPDAEVLSFHNPLDGLEYILSNYLKYTKEKPVILLLDINMPEMDGWEFLNRLNTFIAEQKQSLTGKLLSMYSLHQSIKKI